MDEVCVAVRCVFGCSVSRNGPRGAERSRKICKFRFVWCRAGGLKKKMRGRRGEMDKEEVVV